MLRCLLLSVALVGFVSYAQAEPTSGTGVVCKTQKGMEDLFAYGATHPGSLQEAIDAAAKDDCAIEAIMYERGKNVEVVKHGEVSFDIAEITVVAVCDNGVCLFGKQEAAYSVFKQPQKEGSLPRAIGIYYAEDLSPFRG